MYVVDLLKTFQERTKNGAAPSIAMTHKINGTECEVLRWTAELDLIDDMMEWCLDNCTGKFSVYGSTRWYFTDESDAVSFKLRFS